MKKLFVLLVALCALLMIAGCGGNKSGGSAGKGTPKDTLVVATGVEPATIDPGVSMDVWIVSYPCYDRLVTYKKGSTEVQPSVAESWQASADGLQWTFKLRKDVKFQDGTPLDAKAVKFTFDRILKLKKGPSDYFPTLKSVEVVDANTVKFIMDKPFSPFLYTLATNCGNLVNPKVMDKAKGDDMGSGYLAAATMGSGPYKLAEWNRGQNMKLVANENYWGKKPALKTVILQIIKDASGQRLQLEKGDVDIAKDIPMEQMTELAKNKDIVINQAPGLKVSYLYLNNGKAPFNDVKVRQAMNYAMDYKAILDGTIKGKGLKLGGPIPERNVGL
jgi:peptide/nickel transport system substrate-binding protein